MPDLTYKLNFSSMEECDAYWKKFILHPEWNCISGLKKYAYSVSNTRINFLKSLPYSQL